MGRINGLDDTERSISARGWRAVCLGVNEEGKVKGSDMTWAEWRLLVGIVLRCIQGERRSQSVAADGFCGAFRGHRRSRHRRELGCVIQVVMVGIGHVVK